MGALVRSVFFGFGVFAAAVAGSTVPAAALALPAALPGDPDNGQSKQHSQYDQSDDSTKRQHFCYLFSHGESFCTQYTRFCLEEQACVKKEKCDFFQNKACNL